MYRIFVFIFCTYIYHFVCGTFFNQFEKKNVSCWINLLAEPSYFLLCCFHPWQCTVVALSLLKIIPSHISILRKGGAKKYSAQLRFCFIGNDKKVKNPIEVDFHLLFPLNLSSHNISKLVFENKLVTSLGWLSGVFWLGYNRVS